MNVANSTSALGYSDLYNNSSATRTAKKSLDSTDFMKLLATQFQQQDPMKPMDDTAFMAQMAQFTSLEQTQTMASDLAALRSQQQLLTGSSYLGRTVTVDQGRGSLVTGTVTAIENNSDGVFLKIGDQSYPLGSLRRLEPTPVPTTPTNG